MFRLVDRSHHLSDSITGCIGTIGVADDGYGALRQPPASGSTRVTRPSRSAASSGCGQCPQPSVTVVFMARDRHQRKQVETTLRFAEQEGCLVEVRHSGHTWGQVVAPNGQRIRVWSTPKNADVAARMIRRFVLNNKEG
jgi:hypothetical protein